MDFYCIADEDTVRGFRLAGVAGEVAGDAAQAGAALAQALRRPECGVILLADKLAEHLQAQVEEIRLQYDRPLLVLIPGPDGVAPGRKSLRRLVLEAVGVSLEE